ncbi:MAG: methyltransferase type 12 [Deltaproteobacteria bacterium]|nr:methyltransferase type 12 [Deltaproteobacteria bacterium]
MTIKSQSLMNLRLPAGIEKIDRVIEGYQIYQALLSAMELGLFEFLNDKGPSDRNIIAQGIGINGMFSRDFLDTLVDSGFLARNDEKYINTKAATDFLLAQSPFYQGDWIQNATKSSYWKELTTLLRREHPAMDNFNTGPSSTFMDALAQRSLRGELQAVTEAISSWKGFYGDNNLLDLGGGHGIYAIELCQAHRNLKGVIFDKPHVIDTTLRYITEYQLQERLSVQSGDICSDNIGTGYDIIIISHLLYKFRKELGPIFDRICASLNPGGLLVTNHWFCATGCVSESSGVQELAKSLQSFGHPLCHVEEYDNLFHKKGFKIISTSTVPTSFGPSRLNLAVKTKGTLETISCGSKKCCH